MADTCEKCGEDYTCRRCKCMQPSSGTPEHVSGVALWKYPQGDVPHVAHSLSADAQQARREAVEMAVAQGWLPGGGFDIRPACDAVLKVLGLSEGAAS